MSVSDVKIRPIHKGFIVSHYKAPSPTKENPFPRGDMVEHYHDTKESAAAHMAQLAGKMKEKGSDSPSVAMNG